MNQEILSNNIEIASEAENRTLEIMSEMFGNQVVSESYELSKPWTQSLLETNFELVGIYAGIGAVAGFGIGLILTNIYYNLERKNLVAGQHPDPAHGCGCTIVGFTTGIGVVAGIVIGYLQQR
ncbi:hypothetical protein CVU76_03630 [Candidatus Dojkabacteria bacterium HGW-Dojkabacteria-1]|uniref:Uncharacterized protein n=1 Tax=Candidatus Dojkabacteria bacterium HGW-Dojkabacteria-1 TaxID=2013761 RepID=A0A2N2F4K6_9BACT|nr:MAG: hypothetical protein CVU76_03630 [Candidatus Dojkabacteria bacterium HGW-Dojkabacteria-1]